jgi:hypothetical protein
MGPISLQRSRASSYPDTVISKLDVDGSIVRYWPLGPEAPIQKSPFGTRGACRLECRPRSKMSGRPGATELRFSVSKASFPVAEWSRPGSRRRDDATPPLRSAKYCCQ